MEHDSDRHSICIIDVSIYILSLTIMTQTRRLCLQKTVSLAVSLDSLLLLCIQMNQF